VHVESIQHQPPHVDAVATGDGVDRFDLKTGYLPRTVAVGELTLAVAVHIAVMANTVLIESTGMSVVVIASVAVVLGGLLAGAVQLFINRRLRMLDGAES
jgi:hypothetical protein